MTKLFKALIAGTALLALSGTAFAGEPAPTTFMTTFKYDAVAPMVVTYVRFQKTAKRACKVNHRTAGGLAAKARFERKCQAQLVGDAVKATKLRTLIAYHNQRMGLETNQSKFASLRPETSTN